jgi:hypothetical protein
VPVDDGKKLVEQIAVLKHDPLYFDCDSASRPRFVAATETKTFCRTEFTPGGRRR